MTGGDCRIGMIGLGTMGKNLLLNIADHGFGCAGFDQDESKVAALRAEKGARPIVATADRAEFLRMLSPPRAVMLLVPAGAVVDAVLADLGPGLAKGDIVIDGGNSFFRDTQRRQEELAARGIALLGIGISGGASGARRGPSMMAGGDKAAFERVRDIVEAVSASVHGQPCGAWLGLGAAGHYVKMVHNGIEYAIMRLIAETYDLMKRGLGLSNDQLHKMYSRWNRGHCESYLVEITADIFLKKDDRTGKRVIDVILDEAHAKGTGMWTSENALELHIPVPTIDLAVAMRDMSGQVARRQGAAANLGGPPARYAGDASELIVQLERALHAGMMLSYAQGMALLGQASAQYGFELDLRQVAGVWRGGCIIRSAMLEEIREAYGRRAGLANLLADAELGAAVAGEQDDLRAVVKAAVETGIAAPGFMTCLSYFDSYRSDWSPANLIQAQRDYFGSHRYQRIDAEGDFHTKWTDES